MSDLMITPINEWGVFSENKPKIISGPCSAETLEQMEETAKGVNAIGVEVLRAGLWKPRTLPGNFEGVGEKGLSWLRSIKAKYGLKTITEVANKEHVRLCLKAGIDLLWIGARTTANPFLVQEIADALKGSDIPVFVKNPVAPDINLWIGAIERLNKAGVTKIGVIHRGFCTSDKILYRNDPQWQIAMELRTLYPELPFFVDPSHMAGDKKFILEISQRSLDLGFDGLMIESHHCPSVALSDAKQQLDIDELRNLLNKNLSFTKRDSESDEWKERISELRAKVDVLDDNLLYILSSRMNVIREIGECKREHDVTIFQKKRWNEVLSQVVNKSTKYDLPKGLIEGIFNLIHSFSLEAQK